MILAPGVLDDPVVFAFIVAPTDEKRTVINIGCARRVVKDALRVKEDARICVNSNSKRLLLESGLHLTNVAFSDASPRGNGDVSLVVILFASVIITVSRHVWVVTLSGGVCCLPVVKSLFRTASVAAATC